MQLFYEASLTKGISTQAINPQESNHILRVLRKSVGDRVCFTNGMGIGFKTEIVNIKSKQCIVSVLETFEDKPLPYQLQIAIAPPKSSDRFEFFLEKATEIGITEITPLLCDNSERKRINLKRSQKILQSAMKQSQRLFLPKLNDMVKAEDFICSNFGEAQKIIAHCEEDQKLSLKRIVEKSNNVCGLIGPEGDFSKKEIKLALDRDFLAVSLGDKRLRTETAGLYLTQAMALQNSLS